MFLVPHRGNFLSVGLGVPSAHVGTQVFPVAGLMPLMQVVVVVVVIECECELIHAKLAAIAFALIVMPV